MKDTEVHGNFSTSKRQNDLEENTAITCAALGTAYASAYCISKHLNLMDKSLWYFTDVTVKFTVVYISKNAD